MVKLSREALRKAARNVQAGPVLCDYILAALHLAGGRLSRLRLMKLLHVAVHHSRRLANLTDFAPYRFGAWSEDVEAELEWLTEEGLVEQSEEGVVLLDGKRGSEAVAKIGEDAKLLKEILKVFGKLSDNELLVYVYSVYGGHENSEKKNLLKDAELRLRTALKLYRDGLVSLTLAARIAGLPTPKFARVAREEIGGLITGEEIIE